MRSAPIHAAIPMTELDFKHVTSLSRGGVVWYEGKIHQVAQVRGYSTKEQAALVLLRPMLEAHAYPYSRGETVT